MLKLELVHVFVLGVELSSRDLRSVTFTCICCLFTPKSHLQLAIVLQRVLPHFGKGIPKNAKENFCVCPCIWHGLITVRWHGSAGILPSVKLLDETLRVHRFHVGSADVLLPVSLVFYLFCMSGVRLGGVSEVRV